MYVRTVTILVEIVTYEHSNKNKKTKKFLKIFVAKKKEEFPVFNWVIFYELQIHDISKKCTVGIHTKQLASVKRQSPDGNASKELNFDKVFIMES